MKYADIHAEAAAKREIAKRLLESATKLDVIAAFLSTDAGKIITAELETHVRQWERGGAWGSLGPEAVREQGMALRSRQLLGYFRGAEEEAKRQRAEAEKLIALIEAAVHEGRISQG